MKKLDIAKTVQLIIFLILTLVSIDLVLLDPELYHMAGSDTRVRFLCGVLWLVLLLSFAFLLTDFILLSSYKKDYRELNHVVHSDPVAGIANRFSCDALIDRYLDKPLPDHMGCIMFDLTNLRDINRRYGHMQGNILIRDFSNILHLTSLDLCFVGRNGGNKFLALFEDCSQEKLQLFLDRVQQKTDAHNAREGAYPIVYQYGIAFEDGEAAPTITELIALSNQRIYKEEQQDYE
ncbi:GGDEF domain-containing protein [Laedolimicola intestinihominis]|uniref:GGDEF domain-containing protein n=1 Tax=Laedolimicola intestinihominis TaxID=3133166 RepID=A0ABV1FKI2_9FIRM